MEGARREKIEDYYRRFEYPSREERISEVVEVDCFCPLFPGRQEHLKYFMSIS